MFFLNDKTNQNTRGFFGEKNTILKGLFVLIFVSARRDSKNFVRRYSEEKTCHVVLGRIQNPATAQTQTPQTAVMESFGSGLRVEAFRTFETIY